MSEQRPNIVVMVADDLGLETVGCYGNEVIKTPHIDSLGEDGVTFTNAFCTTASCAASRSVILTGQQNHTNGTYGHTHGKHHFACFENIDTLPKLMNEAGYCTACIGKRHWAPENAFPFRNKMGIAEYGRDNVRMAEACRSFIEDVNPFFLYWCSMDPHRGGGSVEDHPLKPDRFGNPETSFDGDEEQFYSEEDVCVPDFLPDIPEVRAELAQYYQSISRLDRGVGRLLQILKDAGKYDNTLLIFISDNGAAFPASKTTLYEPGMKLPCLVKVPGNAFAGTSCDGLVTWADIAPTVLDFAGGPADANAFHGDSMKPILGQSSPDDWRDEIYAAHTFHQITNYYPMRVVRTRRYKFIWNIASPLTYSFASDLWASATWQGTLKKGLTEFGPRTVDAYLHHPRFELFDLQTDPLETRNLAEEEGYAEMVEVFCEKLKRFQEDTGDPWLHKWEYE